jgi:hypothetical protein
LFAAILMLCSFQILHAQSAKEDMIKEWERAKIYTKEYLDAMPADKYGLKPTPEMRYVCRTNASLNGCQLWLYINYYRCKEPIWLG